MAGFFIRSFSQTQARESIAERSGRRIAFLGSGCRIADQGDPMRASPSRSAAALGLALAGSLLVPSAAPAGTPAKGGAGFSGTWELKTETGDDPFAAEGLENASGGQGRSGGEGRGREGRGGIGGRGGAAAEAEDVPLEAVGDAHRLVIRDDGMKLEITYPTGRKRILTTDGEERELDDGGGPAKVTARRKGRRRERLLVTSEWPEDVRLKETWDLLENPKRLVVEGTVRARHKLAYRRVYEPVPGGTGAPPPGAPAEPAIPTAEPVRTPAPAPPPSPALTATPTGASKPECSLRPPRGTSPAELARMARITAAEAERRAVASVGSQRVSSVIFSDLEVNGGCLVWPLDLRLEGKAGVQEVLIDAGDGKVLSSTFEPPDEPDPAPHRP
jgi:hypothetical protein